MRKAPSFASSPEVRRRMQRQARRDTAPEMALRRELHRRGLRYRLSLRPIPELRRRVDILFPGERVAVEVRGCFWHQCPEHGVFPKANAEWWRQKLARTRRRDEETAARLKAAGWQLIIVWEHENVCGAAARILAAIAVARFLRRKKKGGGAGA